MSRPKDRSFSFSISPSSEHSGLISFRIDWFDFLIVHGTLKSLLQHHSLKANTQPSLSVLRIFVTWVVASSLAAVRAPIRISQGGFCGPFWIVTVPTGFVSVWWAFPSTHASKPTCTPAPQIKMNAMMETSELPAVFDGVKLAAVAAVLYVIVRCLNLKSPTAPPDLYFQDSGLSRFLLKSCPLLTKE